MKGCPVGEKGFVLAGGGEGEKTPEKARKQTP